MIPEGLRQDETARPKPEEWAQAYLLAEAFLSAVSAMVLSDTIFYEHDLPDLLKDAVQKSHEGPVFAYHLTDPQRYGVVALDSEGRAPGIVGKPEVPQSSYTITGLYFLDGTPSERAHAKSQRARFWREHRRISPRAPPYPCLKHKSGRFGHRVRRCRV